jgi:hypothetical protein
MMTLRTMICTGVALLSATLYAQHDRRRPSI